MASATDTAGAPDAQRQSTSTDPHLAWGRAAWRIAAAADEVVADDLRDRLISEAQVIEAKMAATPANTLSAVLELLELTLRLRRDGSSATADAALDQARRSVLAMVRAERGAVMGG